VGTSTSFRAPRRPRWAAFVAAAVAQEPLDRVRSELFNAGDLWEEALGSAPISSYAASVASLFESFGETVEANSPIEAVEAALRIAREDASRQGFSPALPVADRALHRLVLQLIPVTAPSAEAHRYWIEARGPDAAALVGRFSGEVFAEYARHVVDREAGRLVQAKHRVAASAELSQSLAELAGGIGRGAAAAVLSGSEPVGESWPRVIARGFARGRVLPHSTDA